ncbi:Hypothetical_protein [Hexamita inflata]|uniref:Hypothetical_protein n=1 Tax=Hexamita inflata TaxID=28002 RepID=A0AA86TSD1_9EUKA|nr:Hypothetical protein HINF_LOCUS14280 [Hexamita inflata]
MLTCLVNGLSRQDCFDGCQTPATCVLTDQLNDLYCCDMSSIVEEGLVIATKILIGCGVVGAVILILSIIGCYFCCCHKRKQVNTTVFVQGGGSYIFQQCNIVKINHYFIFCFSLSIALGVIIVENNRELHSIDGSRVINIAYFIMNNILQTY